MAITHVSIRCQVSNLPWLRITELSEHKKIYEERDQPFESADESVGPIYKRNNRRMILLPFIYLDVGAVYCSIKAVSLEVLHAVLDHDDEQHSGQW